MDTVNGGSRPLVELARKIFHGNVLFPGKVDAVSDRVGDNLTEHAVAGLFKELRSESEQVIDIEQSESLEVQLQVLVEFSPEAFGLHSELGFLFDEDAIVSHRLDKC